MAVLADQEAYQLATQAPVSDVSAFLQSLLSQKLTALIAQVSDSKAVGQWARGERRPHPQAEQRLRHAYQVARFLSQAEAEDTVRVWFVAMNPDLGDRVPAQVIAEDPAAVMQAARAFLSDSYS